jgi:hypothetical protein
MKAIAATGLLALSGLLAPAAHATEPLMLAALYGYKIEVAKELNGLAIDVKSSGGPVAIVKLSNHSGAPARCRADFNSGLQTPAARQALVRSGKKVSFSYSVPSDIEILRIHVVCTKPDAAPG